LRRLRDHGVRISKLHFSSALKVIPTDRTCAALVNFLDEVYFHQVIERDENGGLRRFRDLDNALSAYASRATQYCSEWRIHFHVPLHAQPTDLFSTTADHLLGVMDVLKAEPGLCSHIEMETYTWEVMPPELKNRSVVDQLVSEYQWTLAELQSRG